MAALPPSDDRTARDVGRFDSTRLNELAVVIAGALVVMALVRFQPEVGGWVLLAVTLLLLRTLFMGGSVL